MMKEFAIYTMASMVLLSSMAANVVATTFPRPNFDSRIQWPRCEKVTGATPDQGDECGWCWALTSALVVSSRMCIARKSETEWPTPEAVFGCEYECGGCDGGSAPCVVVGWKTRGVTNAIVSGDDPKTCVRGDPLTDVEVYRDDRAGVARSVMDGGPCFSIVDEVCDRETGLCEHLSGRHFVRIIGWTYEKDWIVAGTWGETWGSRGDGTYVATAGSGGIDDLVYCPIVSEIN